MAPAAFCCPMPDLPTVSARQTSTCPRGHLLFAPPYTGNSDDPDSHPHVTVADIGGPISAPIIYGSTQPSHGDRGAWWDVIAKDECDGLSAESTFFYPSILTLWERERPCTVTTWAFPSTRWTQLLKGLRAALGFGTGVAAGADLKSGWRGRVVPVKPVHRPALRVNAVVILTALSYSQARLFQPLLPLIDASSVKVPIPHGVRFEAPRWASYVSSECTSVIVVPELLQSLKHSLFLENAILSDSAVLEAPEMLQIEEMLTRHFSLPATNAGERRQTPSQWIKAQAEHRVRRTQRRIR